jgi:hypothetical protein
VDGTCDHDFKIFVYLFTYLLLSQHEKGSIKMLQHLIEQSQAVKDQLERYEISGTDILFIKEIIDGPQVKRSLDIRFVFSFFSFLHFQGDKGYEGREKEKQFLYEVKLLLLLLFLITSTLIYSLFVI